MIKFVIKKDGSKDPFNPEKMKAAIMAAATDAGLSDGEKSNVVSQVSSSVIVLFKDRDEVPTSEIKESILSQLNELSPVVADAWRKYDAAKIE
jgi:transcriptional regulator NrdR family protein